MNAEELITKIMEYYQVHTLSDLSKKLGVGQPAISKWKTNNSINTIKKRCRELGIYQDIFEKDINTKNIQTIVSMQNSTNANVVHGDMGDADKKQNIEFDSIPQLVIADLNNLFKLAIQNNKEDILIDELDDFIYQTKKKLR